MARSAVIAIVAGLITLRLGRRPMPVAAATADVNPISADAGGRWWFHDHERSRRIGAIDGLPETGATLS